MGPGPHEDAGGDDEGGRREGDPEKADEEGRHRRVAPDELHRGARRAPRHGGDHDEREAGEATQSDVGRRGHGRLYPRVVFRARYTTGVELDGGVESAGGVESR